VSDDGVVGSSQPVRASAARPTRRRRGRIGTSALKVARGREPTFRPRGPAVNSAEPRFLAAGPSSVGYCSTMPYIECPDCGHKALSVATRCPRCGHAFPARPLQRVDPSRGRDWPSALLAGTIVIGVIVVVATLRRPGARPSERRAPAVEANAPATTRSAGVDRAPVAPKARSAGPADVTAPLAASRSRTTGMPGPGSTCAMAEPGARRRCAC
jgi:hypothetical protein